MANGLSTITGDHHLTLGRTGNADSDALIAEVFAAITRHAPLRTTLDTIASYVCSHLGFQFCAILLERPDVDLLAIEGSAHLAPGYIEAVNRRYPIRIDDPQLSEGPSSQAFRTGEAVIIEDTERDARFRRWRLLVRQEGIRSLLSVPLRVQGRVIGVLNGYQRWPRCYEDDEIRAVVTVAMQVGVAIEIARVVETQQQAIRQRDELTRELDDRRRLLERSVEIRDMLTQLVLTNRGIPAIARALAHVSGCSVVVQDQFFQLLGTASPDGASGNTPPLTREQLPIERFSRAGDEASRPFEIPLIAGSAQSSARLVAPITAGKDLLGYVSVVLQNSPAAPLTLEAVAHAATALALEISKGRLAREAELRAHHDFVTDLLVGPFDDPKLIHDRARYLGYDVQPPFQVSVFEVDQSRGLSRPAGHRPVPPAVAEHQRLAAIVRRVAETYGPHALVSERHGRLVLILTAADGPRAGGAERVTTAARELAAAKELGISFSVGMGRVVGALDQIPASYREAEQALSIVRRFDGQAKMVRYSDLGTARLLYQVEDPTELVAFAEERLRPVLDYDRQHDGILQQALDAYLMSAQSVPLAAQRLQLHPNTLRYRLHKVEGLLGASLSDLNLLLDLQLALMILSLIGR